MVLTPLSSSAGLYEAAAVWPFTTGSVSVTVCTTVSGSVTPIGSPS